MKLLINAKTQEAVAMKVIDLKKHANAAETVRKEVCVHRMLNDPHVIRFYGRRENGNFEFIFLEYASGGELFDRIGNISFNWDNRNIQNMLLSFQSLMWECLK